MSDEVNFMVQLLDENWNDAINALNTTVGNSTIEDVHGVHPIIMDIRDFTTGRTTDSQGRSRGGNRIKSHSKKESVLSANFTDATCNTESGTNSIIHNPNADIIQGLSVSGAGIPTGTTITSINSPAQFSISNTATATAENTTLTFGEFIYSRDIIVIMETGNALNYPTIAWDIRDETYNIAISIRTRQDDRILNDDTRVSPTGTFGRERIRSLYLLVRYIVEQKRRGWLRTDSTLYRNVNQIMFGERTESNDKKNRIFGYKINVVMKKLAQPI